MPSKEENVMTLGRLADIASITLAILTVPFLLCNMKSANIIKAWSACASAR
jgi:hypothetical protein